eukprot:GHRR01027260.1.p1 GENE.GHRR01027260.1~~GHRR01027260.1.p1  ORF type:complete len:141 (+),score=20.87 GHRR01027260.1:225-647(+)
MAAAASAPPPAPAPIPVVSAASSEHNQHQAQAATPNALYFVGSRLREYASNTFEQRKPWTEVFDRTTFSRPSSLQEAASRCRQNLGYFRVNYLIVILLTVAASFLTHPSSLFILGALMASWVYVFVIKQGPLVLGGKELR